MKRQRPVKSRAPISEGFLPTFWTKKYTAIFDGISIAPNMNCVRYRLNPNSAMFRHIPKYVS